MTTTAAWLAEHTRVAATPPARPTRLCGGLDGCTHRQQFVRSLETHWNAVLLPPVWYRWPVGTFPTTEASAGDVGRGPHTRLTVHPFLRADRRIAQLRLYLQTVRGCTLWTSEDYAIQVATFPLVAELIVAVDLIGLAQDLAG